MGHPYIASLWLGSLALIRSRQKLGVLLLGFVLVAVVAGVANPKRICVITKERVLLFTRPFRV